MGPTQQAMSTQELVDFFTDALIDSTGPDWTCSDGAFAIVSQLAKEGRLDRVLEAFDPPQQRYRTAPSIYENMNSAIEAQDIEGVDGWRTIALCFSWSDTNFITRALNAYAGTPAEQVSA